MPEENKHCLYITLQYRLDAPGFHWAIVLAPKSENLDSTVKDSQLFHVINTLQLGSPVGPGSKPDWRYETKLVNAMRSRNLIARILVAKLGRDN